VLKALIFNKYSHIVYHFCDNTSIMFIISYIIISGLLSLNLKLINHCV